MENNKFPIVSIIIPCRNEENYINGCLDSVIGQHYPKDRLDILIVDGMSTDKTREIVNQYLSKYSFISFLENRKKIVPTALNLGIKHSKGDFILILGSHGNYSENHIAKCLDYMEKYKPDNVGGLENIIPGSDSLMGKAIAFALSNAFGVGNARYRIGSKKPMWVDTVACSCYRRDVFDRIGLFDEDLIRNQDDEFNLRLIKNGGKILLAPDIISSYYARDSISKLWNMYFQYGYFKPLVASKVGSILTWRQLIPSLFIISLILTLLLSFVRIYFLWLWLFIIGLYTFLNLFISLIVSITRKDLRLLFFLIISFSALHFSYGYGYLKGICDFFILKKHLKNKIKDLPLTR